MRMVHVIQRYPPAVGGSETWCQEICRYLAQKGHCIRVLTLNINREEEFSREPFDHERTIAFGKMMLDRGVWVRRYRRSLPIPVISFFVYRLLFDKLFNFYFAGPHSVEMYGRMWREIRAADVVFLHTLPYSHNYVAFALAKLFEKKVVIVPHFHPGHPHYERKSHYWLLTNCDAVLAVSEFEKQYLESRSLQPEKVFVTGNAIHPEEFLPKDLEDFKARLHAKYSLLPGDRLIIFIGRKTQYKGVGHLIHAVKDLMDKLPIRLFLVGPAFEWYHDLYNALSQEEKSRIIEMGVLSHQEKVNLLHMSELLVLPSQFEAFGIVFLEAWICGTPVLGTTEGAMPGVVGNEGFLCRFGDVESLKTALMDALSDKERLKEMGARGRAKVLERYTWLRIGAKVQEVVEKT
ncbi:glycosyltransferase family 4 protein [Desulforhabdus sp. TSK]|uniref:glycosyltransferase family 4 protein n=1 Tax=Desulforhabdus sp. TSK TaxID=2925014 RepID=UPI001FC7C778|nr:glycosyltransferase family 4 protein [Desulforhabdus sp. TSK]GKT10725.1 glycosyl transferase [Desulforhabdus sp. TSK]